MLLLQLIVLSFLFINVFSYDTLTSVFFENLKGHPLLAEKILDDVSKQFIDDQINHYVTLITGEAPQSKKKRSLLERFIRKGDGIFLLSDVQPSATIPVKFPEDILLFRQDSRWFAAALESLQPKEKASSLVIFAYEDGNFTEKIRVPVTNGVQLSSINNQDSTLIAVAEYDSPKYNFHNKSVIYQLQGSELTKVQSIDMDFATDVVFWRIHDEIYMSVADFMSINNGTHYEIEVPVYKWLGKHFDWVQNLPSKGAKKITPFVVDNANFLVVANFRDDDGNTQIYSEIYKYDFHEEKYQLFQRILTKACTDIKVFSLREKRRKDTFLVVANSYDQDKDGEPNYETDSIIYKLVNEYFIPFQSVKTNGIQQWLPVEIKDENSQKFVLFASSRFDGIKSFQYDGWSFMETALKLPAVQGELRFTPFMNTTLIVINKDSIGKTANVFSLEFSFEKNVHEIYSQMTSWCDQGLKKVETLTQSDLFDAVLGKPQRADIEEEPEDNSEIERQIDSLSPLLDKLDADAPREIDADEIVFNSIAFISDLNAGKINERVSDDILENAINISKSFELEHVQISSVEVEESLSLKKLNGHNASALIHSSDNLLLDSVTIHGTLTVPEGVNSHGRINSMVVTPQNVLLREGDQKFTRPLKSNNVVVDNMAAQTVNGENIAVVKPVKIETIGTLRVKNLTIGGYINDVDVPTLEKYSLKKKGDQTITATFTFDSLHGRDFDVFGSVSGKTLSELIGTDRGSFKINQTLFFKNDIFINDFRVLRSFAGTEVKDGKLDLLLKDHPEEQEISGTKVFNDVVIYQGIFLQGRINSRNLDRMKPVVTINENVFLEGDKTITGRFEVEGTISANDVVTPGGIYSFTRLEKEGLRLDATDIEPHLFFIQQLNVDEIFVDTINGQSPQSFVVLGSDESQIIQGEKRFLGDLHITGDTLAQNINSVDVEELDNKVLKIEGDQTIEGKHHVKHFVANTILSKETVFTNTSHENMTINDDFQGGVIKAESLLVAGTINGLSFDDIVNDTVTKDADRTVGGHKHFKNITMKVLHVEKGVMPNEIPPQINELRIDGPLRIKDIKIDHLHFQSECNSVSRDRFGIHDLEDGTVDSDHEFDKIIVLGDAFITSDQINNMKISDLSENTVKIDEPHEFNSVIFESAVLSHGPVLLDGDIENFDFENVVLADTESIFGAKTFKSNLTVNGTIRFNGLMNGLNISEFCKFTMGELENKNLTVNGNAFFVRGPNVANINGANIQIIRDKAWFGDEDTIIKGSVDFEDVIFRDDIEIQGFVDNISLSLVAENYFSKSRDQTIPATFTFENELVFENNITVPEITLNGGLVNGINLDLFVRTALLDDYDQVFENVVFFENCHIKNITGDFTVNGFDLDKDVMRYDKVNMVTGAKTVKNLNVESLNLEKAIKIQDVDVLAWMKNSVLKTTGFNITGKKSFRNAVFINGFQLGGTLNGQEFNAGNIMLKDTQQNITGSKTIVTKPLNPVTFKAIKLKGLLNGVDISNLVNNQAYKNQDNSFKTSLLLQNNITTTNLVIKKMYQGINMTELISNVTNLGVLNNLLQQFEDLLDKSYKLKKSIEGQAYFLHHYRIVQTIEGATNSRKILCPDGVTRIGILLSDDSTAKMDLYGWNEEELSIKSTIRFPRRPDYTDQVLMGRYLYTENHDGHGNFVRMSSSMDETVPIHTNRTISTTSFVLPSNEPCTLFIYQDSPLRIYCEYENQVVLKQILPVKGFKATSVTLNGTLYLIIITQPREGSYPRTDIWRFTTSFHLHQSLFDAHPQSVTTAFYKGACYLAIASGHVQNAMYSGRVEIRRFDETAFTPWQSIELDAPIQVEFAVLPSQELVLYVLTDNPTEPLLVYRYEGIGGFQLKITGSALPQIKYANLFRGAAGQHFIVAQSYDEINVIEAVFKGEKVD